MQKLTKVEQEDGKIRFELDRGRTLLVVVLGSSYTHVRVKLPDRDHLLSYPEATMEVLSNLDRANYLVLPKVKPYDEEFPDNDIEVYEFYK